MRLDELDEMAQLGDRSRARRVVPLLLDPDEQIVQAAATALMAAADPRTVPMLEALLTPEAEPRAVSLARMLLADLNVGGGQAWWARGDLVGKRVALWLASDSMPWLAEILPDDAHPLLLDAVQASASEEDLAALLPHWQRLLTHPDPAIREAVLEVLMMAEPRGLRSEVLAALEDRSADVACVAASVASLYPGHDTARALRGRLDDPDRFVAGAMAGALAEVEQVLGTSDQDADEPTQEEERVEEAAASEEDVAWALKDVEVCRVPLLELLRHYAVRSGEDTWRSWREAALAHDNAEVRSAVAPLAARHRDQAALRTLLTDASGVPRRAAAFEAMWMEPMPALAPLLARQLDRFGLLTRTEGLRAWLVHAPASQHLPRLQQIALGHRCHMLRTTARHALMERGAMMTVPAPEIPEAWETWTEWIGWLEDAAAAGEAVEVPEEVRSTPDARVQRALRALEARPA